MTIWLFNIAMENPENKWRFSSLGKSSISMGHLYHGYVTNNPRVFEIVHTMVYVMVWFSNGYIDYMVTMVDIP